MHPENPPFRSLAQSSQFTLADALPSPAPSQASWTRIGPVIGAECN
jgi:hypothetical protein